jgi:hypothetical protein
LVKIEDQNLTNISMHLDSKAIDINKKKENGGKSFDYWKR